MDNAKIKNFRFFTHILFKTIQKLFTSKKETKLFLKQAINTLST